MSGVLLGFFISMFANRSLLQNVLVPVTCSDGYPVSSPVSVTVPQTLFLPLARRCWARRAISGLAAESERRAGTLEQTTCQT
ncbi:hypothetical protein J6590_081345 [Homalodisca vitripennis]|nr:hypothetical protein J6590_081345 [Homalodisca vitripennis]